MTRGLSIGAGPQEASLELACLVLRGSAPPAAPDLLRAVILLRILPDHPHRRELRHQSGHRPPDSLNPLARDALGVALKKQRDDLFGQDFVKIGAVGPVLFLN